MKFVLFVCTGNYYRSRFAEILFNHAVRDRCLPWSAYSRGLLLSDRNSGSISHHTLAFLNALGIDVASPRRPQQLIEEDLHRADIIVAVKESEHRPLVAAHFARWLNVVEYWGIDDVDVAPPEDALPRLQEQVLSLISRLEAKERLDHPDLASLIPTSLPPRRA